MRRLILLALFMTTPHLLWADGLTLAERVSVKISSRPCDSTAPHYRGSGFIFRSQDAHYALTSEHVVLNGNTENQPVRICHQVRIPELKRDVPARLLRSDWGRGLALLKLEQNIDLDIPQLKDWKISIPRKGRSVVLMGYPHASTTVVTDGPGRILVESSARHLLSEISSMIEVVGAHGEYGMSGGLALSEETNEWIGLLSHQVLTPQAGKPTRVEVPSPDHEGSYSHVLLIPAAQAAAWVQGTLDPEIPAPWLQKDLSASLQGRASVSYGPFLFTGEPAPSSGAIGGDGAGIGGDGAGIGGADGPSALLGISGVRISLLEDHAAGAEQEIGALSRNDLAHRWLDRLLLRETVRFDVLLERDLSARTFKRIAFVTLEEFFSTLFRGDQVMPAQTGSKNPLSQNAQAALGWVETLKRGSQLDTAGRLLLGKLESHLQVASTDAWVLLTKADLDRLTEVTGPEANGWHNLFGSAFDPALELMKELIAIREGLKRDLG